MLLWFLTCTFPGPGESPVGSTAVCMEVPVLPSSPFRFPRRRVVDLLLVFSFFHSLTSCILVRFLLFVCFRILLLGFWTCRSILSIPPDFAGILFSSVLFLFPFLILFFFLFQSVLAFPVRSCSTLFLCMLFRIPVVVPLLVSSRRSWFS